MVNISGTRLSTKALLISCLRKQNGIPLSGTELALKAGISRVAVWKAAEKLRKSGYRITGTESEGYRLENPEDDFLYPWEFPEMEGNIKYWDSTDSTMTRARILADTGADSGTIVLAGRQTAGRGRSGRSWLSEQGGLFATIIDRPSLGIQDYYQPTVKILFAAVSCLRRLIGKEVMIRWPNDIYIQGKKLGGILSELHGEADAISYLNLGIGINVLNVMPQGSGAISCLQLCGKPINRKTVFIEFLQSLKSLNKNTAITNKSIHTYLEGIGTNVDLISAAHGERKDDETIIMNGEFLGITEEGRALIHSKSGTQSFAPGSVSLRIKNTI